MSYTTFTYSNLQVLCSGSTIPATRRPERSGHGAEHRQGGRATKSLNSTSVIQQQGGPSGLSKELKAFTRVTLAPGASQNVQLSIPATDTAYWT